MGRCFKVFWVPLGGLLAYYLVVSIQYKDNERRAFDWRYWWTTIGMVLVTLACLFLLFVIVRLWFMVWPDVDATFIGMVLMVFLVLLSSLPMLWMGWKTVIRRTRYYRSISHRRKR